MTSYEATERTRARRLPERGSHDRALVHAILDEGLVCHLGFVHEGQPFVIPTLHARLGEQVYVHGSAASRMLRALAQGVPACLTVTLVDGLVLARSAFHHSINYRSVVVLGQAQLVSDPEEKVRALHALVEHVVPGRSADVREPNEKELRATSVLRMALAECSAKTRSGPAGDDEEDYALTCWAGVLPLRQVALPPEPDARLHPGTPLPDYVARYSRPSSKASIPPRTPS